MKIIKTTNYSYLEQMRSRGKTQFDIAMTAGFTLLITGLLLLMIELFTASIVVVTLSMLGFACSGRYLYNRRTAQAGIEGERAVTSTLMGLDDSYALINDITLPGKRGNIDHILLCPKGIFCIETKNWKGYVKCYRDEWSRRGIRTTYRTQSVSRQSRKNATELSYLIQGSLNRKIFVLALCVFTNPTATLKLYGPTVPVLRLTELTNYIQSSKTGYYLSENEIKLIIQTILPQSVTRNSVASPIIDN